MKTITKKRKERTLRRTNIARAITLTYSSLLSHLSNSVKANKPSSTGNEEFQARCVREYGEVLYTLSVELHELTKIDFKATHEEIT